MKARRIVGMVVIVILVAFFIVADCILFEPTMKTTITGLLCSPEPLAVLEEDEDEEGGGQAMSRKVVEEGSVLVRNENNTLPLSFTEDKKVNVFGRASTDWLYGGSGSGCVVNENDGGSQIDFLAALKSYGISYNETLTNAYSKWLAPQGYGGSIGAKIEEYYRIADPAINDSSVYSSSVLAEAKAFSNTAIVVISRRAGECVDCPKVQYKHKVSDGMKQTDTSRHYLEISEEEEDLLKYVGANYEKVIVLINSTNVMELGFLETIPGIDSCLIVGMTGTRGAMGIPPLLYGTVSPSGRLADTYAYDLEDHANYNLVGFDGMVYYADGNGLYPSGTNLNSLPNAPTGPYYYDYSEGIYVGYRWFETADAEGVWNNRTRNVLDASGNTFTKTGYDAVVQYPFGFGLSYNTCDWSLVNAVPASGSQISLDTEIKLTVRITNNSDALTRDVVQLYLTPEYHREEIEKASVNLIDFEKTDNVEVKQFVDVEFTLKGSDLVSYDCYDKNNNGNKGYELDRGEYTLSFRSDSHTVKCETVTYNVAETQNMLDDPNTGERVQNRFTGSDALDGISVDGLGSEGGNQEIVYMSRANFPTSALERQSARNMPQLLKDNVLFTSAMEKAWNDADKDVYGEAVDKSEVTFGAKNGLKVYDNGSITELGKKLGQVENFDDPDWKRLLDQLDRSEAFGMIGIGAAGTPAVGSVGKPQLYDYDGPAQAGGFNGAVKTKGVGYPCAFVIAQTWNKQLALMYGASFGEGMKDAAGMNGVFGPGCNIHRSPFGGRNFEYFSEDPLLSGKIVANVVYGLKTQGRYAFVKHLALAEQESGRETYYAWVSEQALREIYLTPFRYAVEEGGAVGIMTSYNRTGGVWSGGSIALQDAVLRKEWDFKGAVITDFSDHNQYMSMNQSIRMGGDLGMSVGLSGGNTSGARFDREVRDAVKNVLFMWLNSEYTATVANLDYVSTNGLSESWVWWIPTLIDIQIVVFISCAVWLFFIIIGIRKDLKLKAELVARGEWLNWSERRELRKKQRAQKREDNRKVCAAELNMRIAEMEGTVRRLEEQNAIQREYIERLEANGVRTEQSSNATTTEDARIAELIAFVDELKQEREQKRIADEKRIDAATKRRDGSKNKPKESKAPTTKERLDGFKNELDELRRLIAQNNAGGNQDD